MARGGRKLTVEFIGDTTDLERAFKRAGRSTDQFASRQSAIAGKLGRAMKVAGAAGVAGLALGLKKSVNVAMSFEKQLSQLGAVTDATGRQMDRLKKQALDMGAATKFSAQEAAAAQVELAKGGMTVKQVLKGGLQGALSLAAAGEMELADAASTTVNALNLFKMRAGESGKVADMLATAANATTADVADFAEALQNGGTAAKAAGWDLKQTTLALEALADIGIKGGEAGTTLKSAMIALSSPTKKQAGAADQLGLKFFKANGEMKSVAGISKMLRDRLGGLTKQQKLATMSTLAGSYGMRGLMAIMDIAPKKLRAYEKGLGRQGTAAKVAAKMQDNLSGKLETLGGALETIGIKVGGVLIPPLTAAVVAATDLLDRIGGSLDNLGGLFDGLGAKAGSLGSLASTFSQVGGKVGQVASEIGRTLSTLFDSEFVADLRAIGAVLAWLGAQVAKVVGGIISRHLSAMAQQFRGVAQIIRGVVQVIAGILTLDFKKAWDGAKLIVEGALNAIVGQIRAATAPIREVASRLGRAALSALEAAWDGLKGVASKAWDAVVEGVRAVIRAVRDAAGAVARAAVNALQAGWDGLKALASKAFDALKDGIRNKVDEVRKAAERIATVAWDAVKGLPGRMLQLGKDMMQGLIDGVRSMADDVARAIKDVALAPLEFVMDKLGIGSPSKVYHQIGVWVGEGFADGVRSMTGKATEAVASMAKAATGAAARESSRWLFPLEARLRQLEALRDRLQAKWDREDRARATQAARTGGGSTAGRPVAGNGPPVVSGGRLLQQMGLQVAESKFFGGVTTNRHAHYPNDHYSGNSIDVNYPGGGAGELRKLQSALAALKKRFGGLVKAFIEDAGTANQHLHATFQASFGRAAKTARAAKAAVGGQNFDRVFPAHSLAGRAGKARMTPGQVMALAMQAGFTRSQARRMTETVKGESSFFPGIVASDNGIGLTQITPWAAFPNKNDPLYKRFLELGGEQGMRNPVNNLRMAKAMFDRGGWAPWHGTRYVGTMPGLEPDMSGRVRGGDGGSIEDAAGKMRDLANESARARKMSRIELRIEGIQKLIAARDALKGIRDQIKDRLTAAVDQFREKWERTTGSVIDKANQLALAGFDRQTDALAAGTPAALRLAALRAQDDAEARASEDQRNQQQLTEALASGDQNAILEAQRQVAATARAREIVALEQQVAAETEQIQQQRADERERIEQEQADARKKRMDEDVKAFRKAEKAKLNDLVAKLKEQEITYAQFVNRVRPMLKAIGQGFAADPQTEAALAAVRGKKSKLASFDGGGVVPGRTGQPVPILAHGQEVVLTPDQARALGGAMVVVQNIGDRHYHTEMDLDRERQRDAFVLANALRGR